MATESEQDVRAWKTGKILVGKDRSVLVPPADDSPWTASTLTGFATATERLEAVNAKARCKTKTPEPAMDAAAIEKLAADTKAEIASQAALALPAAPWRSRRSRWSLGAAKKSELLSPAPQKESSMFMAVFKSFLVVGTLAMAAVGVVSTTALAALALDQITMDQITGAITQINDHAHLYLSGYGVTSALAGLRATRPFVVAYFRDWLTEVVKNQVASSR